ncbi:hypothetical protein BDV39DRAFT_204407 [Aspergillus sergii]|uniref:Uncharacterized protein n=1 Tax=Aspergillus sergii TaxID=1034303 RepID=A0A5N6X6Q2_9EURO|nr:hypothetical protein BDV39DRAFT_204407 [Aspergillus sergii]
MRNKASGCDVRAANHPCARHKFVGKDVAVLFGKLLLLLACSRGKDNPRQKIIDLLRVMGEGRLGENGADGGNGDDGGDGDGGDGDGGDDNGEDEHSENDGGVKVVVVVVVVVRMRMMGG